MGHTLAELYYPAQAMGIRVHSRQRLQCILCGLDPWRSTHSPTQVCKSYCNRYDEYSRC
jgi:hypothetical protein